MLCGVFNNKIMLKRCKDVFVLIKLYLSLSLRTYIMLCDTDFSTLYCSAALNLYDVSFTPFSILYNHMLYRSALHTINRMVVFQAGQFIEG